jgi:hypothetical protein
VLYTLWIVSLIGILVITFANFRYPDMNLIVGVLFLFAIFNSIITMKTRK